MNAPSGDLRGRVPVRIANKRLQLRTHRSKESSAAMSARAPWPLKDHALQSPIERDSDLSRAEFLQRIGKFLTWLDQQDIAYRLLGSLATASYTDPEMKAVNFARTATFHRSQRVPDIDILVMRDDVSSVYQEGRRMLHDSTPSIRVELVYPIYSVDFRPTSPESFLVHNDLHIAVRSELFRPITRQIGGIDVITVDPRTLFHTFTLCGGILRHKDWPKALAMGRYMRDNRISQFKESDYEEFHTFMKLRHQRFPSYAHSRRFADSTLSLLPTVCANFFLYWHKELIVSRSPKGTVS
jgi:hypothetical protein